MSKKTQKKDIPADMWLHVATDALARWGAAGGRILLLDVTSDTTGEDGVMLFLPGIAVDDPRLAPSFVAGLKGSADPPAAE